jgi:hypothetical protein
LTHSVAAAGISAVLIVVFVLGGCLTFFSTMAPAEAASAHHCCNPDSGCKSPPTTPQQHEQECGAAAVDFSKLENNSFHHVAPDLETGSVAPSLVGHVAQSAPSTSLSVEPDPARFTPVLRI